MAVAVCGNRRGQPPLSEVRETRTQSKTTGGERDECKDEGPWGQITNPVS